MRTVLAALVVVSLVPGISLLTAAAAQAQASCRQKCTDEEAACLKRTGNKSQCGDKAKACVAKCR